MIPAEEGGLTTISPTLPNGWCQGETRDEALPQAVDLFDEIILGRIAHNEDVPSLSLAGRDSSRGTFRLSH